MRFMSEPNYPPVHVIGAGLAGSEAAWQLAIRNIPVRLYEMKPERHSPVHMLPGFAELVCSNSLRGNRLDTAAGLLKQELRGLGSLVIEAADATRVPAGGALAVDRALFSQYITQKLSQHPMVTVVRGEVTSLDGMEHVVIATGPLSEGAIAQEIAALVGSDTLSFFDAVAPIVTLESIDMTRAFRATRYDRGDADYINCPMTREEYTAFYQALVTAEVAPVHGEEDGVKVFEGCMPIEAMAQRGEKTIAYGPLRPVGLIDPHTGRKPYAVVQLRQDDKAGTLYNLVGFQTRLKFPEQRRVFSMIPGLEHAEFVRYGVMHRNTYINSPGILNEHYQLLSRPDIFFAGQMTGVEGYVESVGSGMVAGISMACRLQGAPMPQLGPETMLGAMARYISSPAMTKLEPMNANFGLLPPLEERIRDKKKKALAMARRSLNSLGLPVPEGQI